MVVVALRAPVAGHRRASTVAAALSCLGIVAFRLCWGSGIYGLVERILLATAALWILALAPGPIPAVTGCPQV